MSHAMQDGWEALVQAWQAIEPAGPLLAGPSATLPPTLFLDEAAVRQLIAGDGPAAGPRLPDALRALARSQGRLQVLLPWQGFASFCSPGRLRDLLDAALRPQVGEASLCVLVLAHAV
ncbi:MAG TPA: hypothetical protein VK195_20450, partial [Burkholderiaceae bacterium]|nr:hypothetical protein [Burkholderiaceae bacterium]